MPIDIDNGTADNNVCKKIDYDHKQRRNRTDNRLRRFEEDRLLGRERLRHWLRHTLLPRRLTGETGRHLHHCPSLRIHEAPHTPRGGTIHQQQRATPRSTPV